MKTYRNIVITGLVKSLVKSEEEIKEELQCEDKAAKKN